MNQVPVNLLKPHPKNKEFFPDVLPENLWTELTKDIRESGIINPLIVTADYTVLAGDTPPGMNPHGFFGHPCVVGFRSNCGVTATPLGP